MEDNNFQLDFAFVKRIDVEKLKEDRISKINHHKKMWKICWDWEGPTPGGRCQVDNVVAYDYDNKRSCGYWYCAPCKIIGEISKNKWLVVVDYVTDQKYLLDLNGTRLLLDITDIWPPVRDLQDE